MDELTKIWMGNNLSQEGINKLINETCSQKVKEPEVDTRSEFLRLAKAMRG